MIYFALQHIIYLRYTVAVSRETHAGLFRVAKIAILFLNTNIIRINVKQYFYYLCAVI